MHNPASRNLPSSHAGFTLLEILIAVVIVSIGLVAMANLQSKLTGYSAMAKQRTLAINLAEQQIETMQTLFELSGSGVDACSTEPIGFDDLGDCTAGVTLNAGNMPFTLTWAIEELVQNDDGSTVPYSESADRVRPDLKVVTLNVAWTDARGGAQEVEIADIIDATPVFNSGRILARVESNEPPSATFNPSDFPGVVDISIGSAKLKGSTTPEPTIENQGVNVITSFDVVTYLQSDTDAYLQRREEFKVVNCVCQLNTGLGTGREPTVWNGERYVLGAEVTKRTGIVSALESGQPRACDMCCNDHHDADGTDLPYDPFRPAFPGDAGGFDFQGDHAHYHIVDGQKVLAVEGDEYLEVCRFVRKDGFFRLATDLKLENLDVVPEAYPTNYNSEYSETVIDYVTAFTDALDDATYPGSTPNPTYASLAPGIFLGNVGVIKPAMSRGIYVDYMTSGLMSKVKCLRAGGTGEFAGSCDIQEDPPWLEILPFFDVDVTALANWSRATTAITVTNSPISDVETSSFSRGEIELAQNHYDVVTDVTASIEKSNSGLTDTNPSDPDDEFEFAEDIEVTVQIGGNPPAAGHLVTGTIRAGSNQINVETVRVEQTSPVGPCEIVTQESGNTVNKSYVCDLAISGSTASGTVVFTDYNAVKTTGSTTTVLNRKICPVGSAYDSMQVYDDGAVADPDQGIVGERTVLSFSGLTADTTVDVTIEKESDACP